MDCIKTGKLICRLRCDKGLTQLQLAQQLCVSDKTVSKWERGVGCPDVSLLTPLSQALSVKVEEILSGEIQPGEIIGGNMKKVKYYACPECGNITACTGDASVFCCSKKLEALTAVKPDEKHNLKIDEIENEWYITSEHPMLKDHYIAFVAFASGEKLQLIKCYPEWEMQLRLEKRGHGTLLWYCVRDGLFCKHI